ncbi:MULTISPECIES: NADH-quinone oxidoreductase subunit NuoE [unclassified Hyphomicrobium]|uniref:NADH-quinone oxidoreductase subunit NuoE n=1 Tax=unclassified Hyphomicrobium TaxID=2619925 RepID=UPI000213F20E|nr:MULTISPECIES: NADH-quinone oxidoreductase subunit NuoE [unclassified Hyphomicrobium]CCB66111.1 NADH-quinone oxidoreductase chain E (NADH dehydrogenase I, chain E) [Hyphomicrobium sp. MC1]
MAVRRLNPEQPAQFAFTAENLAWARETIAKYPEGKQASAIIPLMWRAQEQAGGWLPEPAIRLVCDMLGMAHIRGMEIATFYTMFQLSPVGSKAHIQVCGTTPCMLRGSGDLVSVCKKRINEHAHETNADGTLSWEEVECIGVCANAPVVQVHKDTYEDLTAEQLDKLLDAFLADHKPKPGSQTGRTASCPSSGPTSLTDATLYDGSTIGAWKKRFEETSDGAEDQPKETTPPSALASPAHKEQVATGTSPASPANTPSGTAQLHPAALTAMANAGLVKELEARGGGKALSAGELDKIKSDMIRDRAIAAAAAQAATATTGVQPELLKEPREGSAPDDLSLIWGVADIMADKLHAMGIWHFDQIAKWTPENVAWFESQLDGFKGRVTRDKWIEQAQKLASGWRPESKAGEKPKG